MADPILLPDCPELRARAEAIARARYTRVSACLTEADYFPSSWEESAARARGAFVSAALAELRDLSTPTGRDHACRWLWALLTGEEPEWCPVWRRAQIGFVLDLHSIGRVNVTSSGADVPPGTVCKFSRGEWFVSVDEASSLRMAEALAAAITAALDWRRGVSNG